MHPRTVEGSPDLCRVASGIPPKTACLEKAISARALLRKGLPAKGDVADGQLEEGREAAWQDLWGPSQLPQGTHAMVAPTKRMLNGLWHLAGGEQLQEWLI